MEYLLPFLVQVWMCLVVISGEIASKMEMAFVFRSPDSSWLQKKCVPSSPNNIIVRFWS